MLETTLSITLSVEWWGDNEMCGGWDLQLNVDYDVHIYKVMTLSRITEEEGMQENSH